MADTDKIFGRPGVAAYEVDGMAGHDDPRFGDFPAQTITVEAQGPLDLPIYSVVVFDGNTIALYEDGAPIPDTSIACITTAAVVLTAGQNTTLDVYNSGHWNIDMLNWHSSVDTDAKRLGFFRRGSTPDTLMGSKKHFSSEDIPT